MAQAVAQPNTTHNVPPGGAQDEAQDGDPSRGSWLASLRGAPPWLVSSIIHAGVIIVLALLTLPQLQRDLEFALEASASEAVDTFEEIPELELAEAVEVEDVTPLSEFDPSDMALGEMLPSDFAADIGSLSAADMMGTMGSPLGDSGASLDPIGQGGGELTSFFGQKAAANRIVFMVDNSNSMTGGKLETALVELAKAIENLKPTQQFYIVFYSDTAYGLFHPEPAKSLVMATPSNKYKALQWLNSIEMCLKTDGRDALAIVRQLRPNLIYLLGDGAFTDSTAQQMVNNPMPSVVIHTLGMNVREKDAIAFRAIAERHKGTYVDVGVTPEGQSLLQQMGPRPRHRFHENYWGLKLPEPK